MKEMMCEMMKNMKPEFMIEMMDEMINSDMAEKFAPKMMPKMMPKCLNNFLSKIPEKEREELIKKIVDIITSKYYNEGIDAKYVKGFETDINIKGLKIASKGGKGSVGDKINPMDLFLSGLCGCISIAVGKTLEDLNIKGEVKVNGTVKKSFEKGCIEQVVLNINVEVNNCNKSEEELREIILEGSKKCLISNSLKCELIKNVILKRNI
ncbi:OsmC family protein [Methanothermococcus okinawensis]|uniref:OsmC family protein n=1 Tax=Methanothermococcus okinawensis (strain DSM 14208 / JCM 11175 / IH1) TaxID=647113 RepID=F8ALA4_METOI|nr:OsmC family protein [Methanothermococcus okinawensis]AEH06838.1 OsmC family protein [Methanothermococcus okinawensis IH1]